MCTPIEKKHIYLKQQQQHQKQHNNNNKAKTHPQTTLLYSLFTEYINKFNSLGSV